MLNNIRLVQIIGILCGVLLLLRGINSQASFKTKAQNTNVTPSFACLGPCSSSVSTIPVGSTNTTSSPNTTSTVSQPCQSSLSSQIPNEKKSKNGRGRGGFLGGISRFLSFLVQIILQLLGLSSGSLTGLGSGFVSSPSPSPSSSSSSGNSSIPCPPSTSSASGTNTSPPSSSAAASASATAVSGLTDPNTCGNQGQGAGVHSPIPQPKCTINATDINGASAAKSGDVVCFTGNLSTRLTADKPGVIYFGGGTVTVPGVDVTGEGATVQGFVIQGADAPGIMASGKNITVTDNKVEGPTKGGDNDGMRFFGDGLKILHNTISNIQPEGGAHADCMQTYATGADSPATSNTIVDSNRCENIANICWIIEGPNSTAGDGSGQGQDSNDLFINNYCNGSASDGVFTDDVHGFKFINNDMEGNNNAAITFTGSQGDNVAKCTKMGGGTKQEVNIDAPR